MHVQPPPLIQFYSRTFCASYYYNRRTRVPRWTLPSTATYVPDTSRPSGYRIFIIENPNGGGGGGIRKQGDDGADYGAVEAAKTLSANRGDSHGSNVDGFGNRYGNRSGDGCRNGYGDGYHGGGDRFNAAEALVGKGDNSRFPPVSSKEAFSVSLSSSASFAKKQAFSSERGPPAEAAVAPVRTGREGANWRNSGETGLEDGLEAVGVVECRVGGRQRGWAGRNKVTGNPRRSGQGAIASRCVCVFVCVFSRGVFF